MINKTTSALRKAYRMGSKNQMSKLVMSSMGKGAMTGAILGGAYGAISSDTSILGGAFGGAFLGGIIGAGHGAYKGYNPIRGNYRRGFPGRRTPSPTSSANPPAPPINRKKELINSNIAKDINYLKELNNSNIMKPVIKGNPQRPQPVMFTNPRHRIVSSSAPGRKKLHRDSYGNLIRSISSTAPGRKKLSIPIS